MVTLYLPLGRLFKLNFPETSVDAPNSSPPSETKTTFAPSSGALLFSLITVPETEISIVDPIRIVKLIQKLKMYFTDPIKNN